MAFLGNDKSQKQTGGDNAILIQAGRDINLVVRKSPPNLKLAKISIEDDDSEDGLKQKINLVIKNNGDASAVLLEGHLIVEAHETITNCNYMHARYSLVESDWTYEVDLAASDPKFVGKHAIAPNEVVSFDILVGRKFGGPEVTVYKTRLRLVFDEGNDVETDSFFLRIIGPTSIAGAFIPNGPSPEEWGLCMADNIRRLDSIGYDFRPSIDKGSRRYISSVAPELFRNGTRNESSS